MVGKRVVQKVAELTLRINDEPVESDGKALRFYRVEQVDGPSLLLKAESQGTSGWASAADVIRGRARPSTSSARRSGSTPKTRFHSPCWRCSEQTRTSSTWPSANYDEAIRLDPRNAASFAGRATRVVLQERVRQGHRRLRRSPSVSTPRTPSPTSAAA